MIEKREIADLFYEPTVSAVKMSIRGLSKAYVSRHGEVQALDRIDLDIFGGEVVCVIGESGCGKSSLLHILAGFEVPSHGQVLVDGQPISGPSYRRAIVFQQPSLLPWLTVEQNITLGQEIRGLPIDPTKVRQLIEVMGLNGFERYHPAQLSGGMAQRVAIARALANDPDIDVLLLDEPFSALDAFTRIRLQEEFLRVWECGRYTTVFITHDLDEAVFLGTRVVVLTPRPGRIARVFNVHLRLPRDRNSVEFLRLRGMIAREFTALTGNEREEQ